MRNHAKPLQLIFSAELLLFLVIIKEVFVNPFEFKIWLIVVAVITFIIVFLLWMINVFDYHRTLKELAVPQLFKTHIRKLSIFKLVNICLLPHGISGWDYLKGHRCFLEWDIRWGAFGRNLGTITEVINNSKLVIHLDKAVQLGSNSFDFATFSPFRNNTALRKYFISTVEGKVELSTSKETLTAWGDLLVYK